MRTPNLNSLRMFDAAARHLNFRLAAEELHLTQGAVAQQVRRLEADLGCQLFQRQARGLALTEIGRSYHIPIRRALAMIDDATRKLRPQSTQITLSVTPSFAAKWLVPRLATFADVHPDIELQTVASEGLADFKTDRVDIAIRQGYPPTDKNYRIELLAPLKLCAVCSPAYAEKIGPISHLQDFTTLRLMQDSHKHWDVLFEQAGIELQQRMMQFNQTALAMDAAASGQGIVLAPRLLLDSELTAGRLTIIWRDDQAEQSYFYLICPDLPSTNAARDAVIKWILSEIRKS